MYLWKWKSLSHVWLLVTSWTIPWNSPGQNTGVCSLSLLQGIFPTLGLNPGLPHCRWILYQLSHQGRPRTLEWVAYPFSGGSSQPRNQTGVFCIAGGFFMNWAMKEALSLALPLYRRWMWRWAIWDLAKIMRNKSTLNPLQHGVTLSTLYLHLDLQEENRLQLCFHVYFPGDFL